MKYGRQTASKGQTSLQRACLIFFSVSGGLCIPLRGNVVCNFVYIFIAHCNFLNKFCSSGSDPSFNRNILTSLDLKYETSVHAQLLNYLFIHAIYKFHEMVSAGNLH